MCIRDRFISLTRKRAFSTWHTASSNIAVNTTASSLCTTASQVLCRRSRGPRSKAQETRYPVLIARRLREWAGILVFGTFSIQCAARHMDISAFVPLQDLGFGRRAARLAVQCVFRNEEETRSEFLSLIRQRPTVSRIDENPSNVFLCSPVFSGGRFWSSARRTPCFPSRTLSNKMSPAQRDHHARATERKAKAGYLGDPG